MRTVATNRMPRIRDTCKNCDAEVGALAIYCDYCRYAGYSL